MPHPALDNRTPFAVEVLPLADGEARPVLVPLLQATFAIGADGTLEPVEPAPAIAVGGQWWGDPALTSLRLEPQIAPFKPATDVVLLGHAVAPGGRAVESLVGLRIGTVQKVVRVFGDRRLIGRSRITAPEPFERIPLRWEHAFGGHDRRHDDPARHCVEPRNPLGRGFRDARLEPDDDVLLPNLEDPQQPLRGYGECPPPAGFGFVAPDWAPRCGFAGTYDDAWVASRRPRLPADFDPRFFNAASAGLALTSPLRGDEPVTVAGVVPEGRLDFRLPSLPPPQCTLVLRGERRVEPELRLDTVVVDADARTVALTWRGCQPVRTGPQDLLAVQVRVPGLALRDPRFHA